MLKQEEVEALQIKVGKAIRAKREQHKSQQKDAAAAIGVDPATMNKYESGMVDIPTSRLIMLSQYYECSVDELVGRDKMSRAMYMAIYTVEQALKAIMSDPALMMKLGEAMTMDKTIIMDKAFDSKLK